MSSGQELLYGCLFCNTGKEQFVADNIQSVFPQVRAVCVCREKHHTHQGVKSRIVERMLPGYVFFSLPSVDGSLPWQFPRLHVHRLLQSSSLDWRLYGADEQFARWIIDHDGLLSFSTAYQEGDRIQIIAGPLKDFEGMICRVDRRGRSGQVVIPFNGREIRVWLGFDLLENAVPC